MLYGRELIASALIVLNGHLTVQFSRDVMNDPANLPCNHVFCNECIMESLKGEFLPSLLRSAPHSHSRRATVRKGCPLCKVRT